MTDIMAFREVVAEATQAYLAVLRKHPTGWTPPPGDIRDKRWARQLRDAWPDSQTVYLPNPANARYSEMRKWCDEKAGSYWCSSNGDAWYFEDRKLAVLFKLTFGGDAQ